MLAVMHLKPGQVKSMTYQIDTCHFLAWRSALLEYDKDWFAQYRENVTEWDTESWALQ